MVTHLRMAASALMVASAFMVVACGEEPNEDGWFDFEVPVSFEAEGMDLLDRFKLDHDGLGYVLEGIQAEDTGFDRVAFMVDAEGEPKLEVRVSADGGASWSEWIPAIITWSEGILYNAHADVPHGGTNLEVRLQGLEPREVSFLLLEGFILEPDYMYEHEEDLGGLGTETQALAANRAVDVSRSGWGARASRCSARHTINRITVHHTATPSNEPNNPARMRQMQSFHMDSRGFCDIGYHFVVGTDGRVYQGRAETLRGAHVANNNSGNAGVSFIGTYSSSAPSGAMMHAGARAINAIGCHYGVSINRTRVKGHREYGSTNCPGNALYNRLGGLVSDAASMGCGGQTAPAPAPSPQPSPSPSPGTALVQGIVHEAGNTSRRISGATVRVAGQTATTNSNGYYNVRVSSGTHTITASASGYQTGSVTRTAPAGSETWGSVGLSRQAASSGQGTLVGVVYEAPDSSRRLAGASVRLSNGATTTTNSNGYFAFSVPAGNYTVTASHSGFQTGSVSRRVTSGTIWGSVGLRRQEARGVLQGVVYESPHTNRRISGARVTLSTGQTATASSNGYFRFDVPPGTYRITASHSGYSPSTVVRTVGSGQEVWGSVGLSKVASATGDLIGVIYVRPDTSERVPGAQVWTSTGQSTTANANGVYTLSGVPAGEVSIYASAAGYTSGSVQRNVRADQQIWGSVGLAKSESGGGVPDEGTIMVIAPKDGAGTGSNPEFEWENISAEQAGTADFSYRVVVVSHCGTESHEGSVTGAVGGTSKSSIGLSLSAGRWMWSVYAITDSGDLVASSEMEEFEVG